MKKKTFTLATTTNSTTTTHTFENGHAAEKVLLDTTPTPPSEETIARLNAIGREYPFCAYIKQNNNLYLL